MLVQVCKLTQLPANLYFLLRLMCSPFPGLQRNTSDCDTDAAFYWSGMAILSSIALLSPTVLGITALFAKLGLMVAGGVVLASFMTYASEHLAISAFVKGQRDRNASRGSICFMC
jgi:hypothetical protein